MLEKELQSIVKRKSLEGLMIKPLDNYYDHISFSVDSLSDYIRIIESITTVKMDSMEHFYYRGMADCHYTLEPSLMRKKMPIISTLEHDLSVEFNSEMPDIFKSLNSNFEKLASMQHYGIPTRFLDFTLNPLIALFFACEKGRSKDGRVVFTKNYLNHFDNVYVECISSLFLSQNWHNVRLEDWLNKYGITIQDYLYAMYTVVHSSNPLFVRPPYVNARMKNQQSVFLLFHNAVRDLISDRFYFNNDETNKEPPYQIRREKTIDIYKEQIKEYKKKKGKKDDSPFDYHWFMLDKTVFDRIIASYKKDDYDSFKRDMDSAFENRFLLQDMLEPLEMEDIWFDFSSVIIPAKNKSKILYQLNQVGINEAFVYPENEYVAKIISKQFM